MIVANDRLTSSGMAPAYTVARERGATVIVRITVPPYSTRNVSRMVADSNWLFTSRMNVSK